MIRGSPISPPRASSIATRFAASECRRYALEPVEAFTSAVQALG